MPNREIAFGCFVAALAPGLCVLLYVLLTASEINTTVSTLSGALIFWAISFAFAGVPTLLIGLPYILWLRSRNSITWGNICLGSAIVGSLTFAALTGAITWSNPTPGLLVGAGLGLAGGLAFCLAARPNNSFKPKPLRGSA